MRNAAEGGATVQSEDRNEGYHSIVSELVSLIERVQAGMKLLESAIGSEAVPGGEETAADIVVLDDVTPRYAMVNAALSSCSAGLDVALRALQDTRTARQRTDEFAGRDRRLVLIAQAQGA
jgi:hypothetical protein